MASNYEDTTAMANGEWFYSNNFNSMFISMSAPETPLSLRAKHYEWNLFDGKRWLEINNDFIIECNYCQPGTKGITIDTHLGSLYIDFDAMTLIGPYANLAVRRLSTMSHDQREDMGWFYRDNGFWCEYGEQGSSCSTSSVSSQDLELQYNYNPKGSYQFTAGKTLYILNFSDMMQTNLSTHKQRKVRRRPKFISTVYINNSLNTLEPSTSSINTFPSATQTVNPPTAVTWQFMDEEGIWKDYQKPNSSLDSMDIERQYQSSPHGQLDFSAGWYSYTLSFDGMYQINKTYKTTRAVRRIVANESKSSTLCQVIWQFKDMDSCWKDFIKGTGRGKCTISSQQIEMQYQQNRAGTIRFSSDKFNYQINFSDMTQTNLSTLTRRAVRRV
ncbi:zinc finger CCCH-type antiviral protein 1 isoform X1 [Silurus meridionalis]|uniref:zinc finger CCCH-type antiviral protein 1 isoform X1 n=1 Tax=Silurus meridionalis TaxID=175797 RepID=UPI001EEC3EC4|nr:zinc finger CCCH-type antiviral protein 1 isoform X1 [Silurus meridionalis]